MKRPTAVALALAVIGGAVAIYFTVHALGRGPEPDPGFQQVPQRPREEIRSVARDHSNGQGAMGGELGVLIDDDPKGALRLEGQVLGDGDKPVGGATIVISSNPVRTTTSEDDGSFAFDALVGRSYVLVARAQGAVAGPLTAHLTSKTEPVILHLRPAGTLDVLVVDTKQKPVAGAAVELRGTDTQAATTGADGHATITPVVPGGYDVVASAPGYARSFAPVRINEGKAEVQLALAQGAPVAGIVIDDQGAPVANARVVFSGASDWSTQGDERLDGVVSGKDGSFKFAALPAGSWRFVARHPDHAPGTSVLVTLDGQSPRDGVEVRLPPGATVSGSVVDGNGTPVPSARVRVGVASAGMLGDDPRQVYSDDRGQFQVRGLPRRALSAVAIHESGASATVPVDTTAGDVPGVALKLDVTGTIAGVVVDDNGQPLEGVQVSAFPDFRARGNGNDMAQWRLRGFPQELTDGAGKFTLTGLAKGSYRVRASRAKSAARGRGFAGEGTSAETGTTDLRIVLPPEGGVKGKVTFADGSPVGPYTVGVGFTQQPAMAPDGSFLLDGLTPDHYTLQVRGNGFVSKSVEVDVKGGQVADAGTITVEKGRMISGKVVAAGQPVAGATVYAGRQIFGNGSSSDARFGGGPPMAQGTRHTTTTEDGSFSLSGFGDADLVIVAEEPSIGRSTSIRLLAGDPGEQNLTLELQKYGALKGVLKQGGQPAEGTIVTAQSATSANTMYSVATGPDGAYRFDKLAPDVYKVSATLGMPMRGMKFYSQQVTLPPAQEVTVDLTYTPGTVNLKVDVVPAGGKMGPASAWLFSGNMAVKNGRELALKGAAQGAGSSQWNIIPGGTSTTFTELDAGLYTACVLPFPAEIQGFGAMEYAAKYSDVMPVFCKGITLAASPTDQTLQVPVEAPPMIHDADGTGTHGRGGPRGGGGGPPPPPPGGGGGGPPPGPPPAP